MSWPTSCRNPLAPILNAVEVLRLRRQVTPELEPSVTMVERQTRHLERLIRRPAWISRRMTPAVRSNCAWSGSDARMIVEPGGRGRARRASDRGATSCSSRFPRSRFGWRPMRCAGTDPGYLLANCRQVYRAGSRIWLELDLSPGRPVSGCATAVIGIAPKVLPIHFSTLSSKPTSRSTAPGRNWGSA